MFMRLVFFLFIASVVSISFADAAQARAMFSPNGDTIATVTDNHEILLWQNTVTRAQFIVGRHEASVNSITFSTDGARLLSASDDGTARLWDLSSGELILTLTMSDPVEDARFSANGHRILTRSAGGKLGLYHANDGSMVKALEDYVSVVDADISADGSRIVVTDADGRVQIWDDHLAGGELIPSSLTMAPGVLPPNGWVSATADKQALLEGWVSSWAQQNLDAYFSYYAQGYTPGAGTTHEQWRSIRSQRITRPARISITVSDLQTRQLDRGQIEMRFQQRYQSDAFSDTCLKRIVWSGSSGSHRILSEQTLNCL